MVKETKGIASISLLFTTRLYNHQKKKKKTKPTTIQGKNTSEITLKELCKDNFSITLSFMSKRSSSKEAVTQKYPYYSPSPPPTSVRMLYITYPSHCLNEWSCFVFFHIDPVYFSSMGQCFCHIWKILLKGSSIKMQSWIKLSGVIEHRRLLLFSF